MYLCLREDCKEKLENECFFLCIRYDVGWIFVCFNGRSKGIVNFYLLICNWVK